MSVTFTKLFSSITASTIWAEPDHTRIVWITMLAMADRHGRVWASIPGLANVARVTVEKCEAALAALRGADKYSRTKNFDGRRIEDIEGGWLLLNHGKYRAIRDDESIKESKRRYINARRKAEREGREGRVENCRTQANAVDRCRGNAEADTEAEEIHTPTPRKRGVRLEGFELLWSEHPRKVNKAAAQKAFSKLAPCADTLEAMIAAIRSQRDTDDWRNDGGRFVPHLSTWINGRRWEDEAATPRPDIFAGAL